MKKTKFINYLSKKYSLPSKYVRFIVDPIYIYKANYDIDDETITALENSILWDRVSEKFEYLRRLESSVFYGM